MTREHRENNREKIRENHGVPAVSSSKTARAKRPKEAALLESNGGGRKRGCRHLVADSSSGVGSYSALFNGFARCGRRSTGNQLKHHDGVPTRARRSSGSDSPISVRSIRTRNYNVTKRERETRAEPRPSATIARMIDDRKLRAASVWRKHAQGAKSVFMEFASCPGDVHAYSIGYARFIFTLIFPLRVHFTSSFFTVNRAFRSYGSRSARTIKSRTRIQVTIVIEDCIRFVCSQVDCWAA